MKRRKSAARLYFFMVLYFCYFILTAFSYRYDHNSLDQMSTVVFSAGEGANCLYDKSGNLLRLLINRNINLISNGDFESYSGNNGLADGWECYVPDGNVGSFAVNDNNDSILWNPKIAYHNGFEASKGFSKTQGTNLWYYEEYSGVDYLNLTWDGTLKSWKSQSNVLVGDIGQHPSSTSDAIRKWIAPATGVIQITGQVAKGDVTGGDGVHVKILKNISRI